MRSLCKKIAPSTFNYGFQPIALELSELFEEKHNLQVLLDLQLPNRAAPRQISRAVYRILLESLNNVVKHAQVDKVKVSMKVTEKRFSMIVEDSGVGGVNRKLAPSYLLRGGHIGVLGMQDWAAAVGGQLMIGENEPQGTKVALEIPLD